ncbi:MAG: flagellar hook-length control protein FliK [Bacillota bacterium]|jgi:hypothetical protein|nr:flagellar hook-length control protein FliK [Bacillota bacterium]
MEINEYSKQHRLHRAASEYEASQAKAQHIKPSSQEQNTSSQMGKNAHATIKGEIIDLRYQEVKIRLEPNGQVITARLTADVPLHIGQIAEFALDDEKDGQITLRYISTNKSPINDIAYKALYASGLAASERNLAIVEELLSNQMPVDKNTILQLIKLSATYPEASLTGLVLMHKNHLPINSSSIGQFELYQKGLHEILSQLKTLIDNIGSFFETENKDNLIEKDTLVNLTDNLNPETQKKADKNVLEDGIINEINKRIPEDMPMTRNVIEVEYIDNDLHFFKNLLNMLLDGNNLKHQLKPDTSLGHILSKNELMKLQELIFKDLNEDTYSNKDIMGIKDQLADGTLTFQSFFPLVEEIYYNLPPRQSQENNVLLTRILQAYVGMSENMPDPDKQKLAYLLKSDSVRDIISQALHHRWTLSPRDLTKDNKVKEFYKRLDEDLDYIKELTSSSKLADTQNIQSSINKLQDNLQFMRDLNNLFSYIQLPIRLSNQDVHGDLYVFTRKNKKHIDTGQLNILLHLDMKSLGPMDIHLSMKNKQFYAVFYLEKSSEKVISQYLHELIDSLQRKGYQFQASTKISDTKPDFITDILQDDTPNPGSHRYSFDIRA